MFVSETECKFQRDLHHERFKRRESIQERKLPEVQTGLASTRIRMVRSCKRHLKHSGGGKGRAKGSGRPRQQFAGAAIDGQTFGVLALALQRVLLSLYLFLSFSLIQEKKKL